MSKSSELTYERVRILTEYLEGLNKGQHIYPAQYSKNDKKVVRQQSVNYIVKDNLLYYANKQKVSQKDQYVYKRVIYKVEEKEALLKGCHDGIDGGHLGQDKTYSKVIS